MFAVFIMAFMWCLTIAALIAAWYVASGKLGLFWSALGFLGTLLFALIPLRNAVPGDPPIGSLIDFAAFFIAEGVVSISMIVTVLHGYHIEISNKKKKGTRNSTERSSEASLKAQRYSGVVEDVLDRIEQCPLPVANLVEVAPR